MSAISFKTLTQDDVTTSRTLLHESIPITGTLVSGTYETSSVTSRGLNVKTFSHGMFQSIYDYPYASSSANHVFDLTVGCSTGSYSASGSIVALSKQSEAQVSKKVNIYNQMAQVLVGYDTAGNIRRFDADGDYGTTTDKMDDMVFMNFSRLLVKDEIKKGSFELKLGGDPDWEQGNSATTVVTITDAASATNYRANSPAGEYGFLKNGSTTVGLIYYQAGIVALTASAVGQASARAGESVNVEMHENAGTSITLLRTGSMDAFSDGVRNRIHNIKFNNTTELNSTIYFCRANKGEFNYSSNPTYLTGSKIRVKEDPGTNEYKNMPMSYVTTVGLYSPDNELLAVAKLSEPIKKTPINELNLRVRLDY